MNTLFSIFFLMFPFFVSSFEFDHQRPESSEFYIPLAGRLTNQIASNLERKHNMEPYDSGGSMMGNVQELAFSFKVKRSLSHDECRKIIVDCVEEFLKSLNENKEIRPYLSDYPFLPKNLSISLHIRDKDGGDLPETEISNVRESQGTIIYRRYPKDGPGVPVVCTIIEEPYEEAKKIVLGENQGK